MIEFLEFVEFFLFHACITAFSRGVLVNSSYVKLKNFKNKSSVYLHLPCLRRHNHVIFLWKKIYVSSQKSVGIVTDISILALILSFQFHMFKSKFFLEMGGMVEKLIS